MKNGDISNSTPIRILVNYDFIINKMEEKKVERKWFKDKEVITEVDVLDRVVLNKLWLLTDRIGCVLELFVPSNISIKDLETNMENVVNPFTSIVKIGSLYDIVKTLPYRPDVQGVIDHDDKTLVYGSKFFHMSKVGL